MKAILVLDEMPKNCGYCQFHQAGLPGWCDLDVVNYRDIENEDIRQKWCPLKPLPQKKDIESYIRTYYPLDTADDRRKLMLYIKNRSWNECLDEILGERK